MQRERLIQRRLCTYPLIQACAHTPTQTGENNNRSEGLISKTYISEYLHNREVLRRNSKSCSKQRKIVKPVLLGVVPGLYVESGEVLKCYSYT